MSSDLPASSPYRSRPGEPVTDAERERLSARLNAAYAGGSLSDEDYQARLDGLFRAARLGELVPVVQGLPPVAAYDTPDLVAGSAGPPPGELAPARDASRATLLVVGGIGAATLLIVLLAIVVLLL